MTIKYMFDDLEKLAYNASMPAAFAGLGQGLGAVGASANQAVSQRANQKFQAQEAEAQRGFQTKMDEGNKEFQAASDIVGDYRGVGVGGGRRAAAGGGGARAPKTKSALEIHSAKRQEYISNYLTQNEKLVAAISSMKAEQKAAVFRDMETAATEYADAEVAKLMASEQQALRAGIAPSIHNWQGLAGSGALLPVTPGDIGPEQGPIRAGAADMDANLSQLMQLAQSPQAAGMSRAQLEELMRSMPAVQRYWPGIVPPGAPPQSPAMAAAGGAAAGGQPTQSIFDAAMQGRPQPSPGLAARVVDPAFDVPVTPPLRPDETGFNMEKDVAQQAADAEAELDEMALKEMDAVDAILSGSMGEDRPVAPAPATGSANPATGSANPAVVGRGPGGDRFPTQDLMRALDRSERKHEQTTERFDIDSAAKQGVDLKGLQPGARNGLEMAFLELRQAHPEIAAKTRIASGYRDAARQQEMYDTFSGIKKRHLAAGKKDGVAEALALKEANEVHGMGLLRPPALRSHHTAGTAIDIGKELSDAELATAREVFSRHGWAMEGGYGNARHLVYDEKGMRPSIPVAAGPTAAPPPAGPLHQRPVNLASRLADLAGISGTGQRREGLKVGRPLESFAVTTNERGEVAVGGVGLMSRPVAAARARAVNSLPSQLREKIDGITSTDRNGKVLWLDTDGLHPFDVREIQKAMAGAGFQLQPSAPGGLSFILGGDNASYDPNDFR